MSGPLPPAHREGGFPRPHPPQPAASYPRPVVMLVLTVGLVVVRILLARLAPGSVWLVLATAILVIWLLAVGIAGTAWLWRRLTYRVGIRLFLSYLIIGVLPFLLLGTFGAILVTMAAGQYASVRFGTLLNRTYEAAASLATATLDRPPGRSAEVLAASDAASPVGLPRWEWVVETDGPRLSSPGLATAGSPAPQLRGDWSGPLLVEGRAYLAVARQRGGRLVIVMVPFALATRAAAAQAPWLEATSSAMATFSERSPKAGSTLRVEGGVGVPPSEQEAVRPLPAAPLAEDDEATPSAPPTGWLARRFVVWPRISKAPVDWQTGAALPDRRIVVMLRTSLAEAG